MDKILKVATFNVVHCADISNLNDTVTPPGFNPEVRIDKYIDALKNINADFIGLNEVYNTTNFDVSPDRGGQSNKLASGANYPFSFFGRGKLFVERNQDIGNAVLSHYPITSVKTHNVLAPTEDERRVDETDWYEDRVIVEADLLVNDTTIKFISTHFGLNKQERERMVAKLITIIDATKTPLILAGDFNSQPDDEVIKPIYDRLTSASDVAGIREQKTFATYNPFLTIDYIFYSKHFELVKAEVLPLKLSDHYPLTANLKLK